MVERTVNEAAMTSSSAPEPFYVARPLAKEINCLKMVPGNDGTNDFFCFGTTEGDLGVMDLATMRTKWSCTSTTKAAILAVDVCSDNHLMSLSKGCGVEVWDMHQQTRVESIRLDNHGFCKFHLQQKEGKWCFALGSSEFGQVNIFSKGDQKPALTLSVDPNTKLGSCMAVRYLLSTLQSEVVMAGFESGDLVLWDVRKPTQYLSLLKLYDEPIMCLDYSHVSAMGLCGSPGSIVKSFHCTQEGGLRLCHEASLKHAGQSDVCIRSDGKIACTGGWDSRLRLFSMKKLKPLAVMEYHSSAVTAVDFFPACASTRFSNVLAAGSRDRRISFWNMYS